MENTFEKEYKARIDLGQGGERTIIALDPEEALTSALEWAKEGDWTFSVNPSENIVLVEVALEGEDYSDFTPSYRRAKFTISDDCH